MSFHNLLVLEPTSEVSGTNLIYKCKCLCCGEECFISSKNIKNQFSCGCIRSKGEQNIISLLKENNILYQREKTFDDCVFPDTNRKAKFDFYLPDLNILIEYDGQQHFMPVDFGNYGKDIALKRFSDQKVKDNYKNQWCINKGITLIRIPYTCGDFITLDDLLSDSQFRLLELSN